MVDEHPFQLLFESFGRLSSPHADSVNRRGYETLGDVLAVPLEHAGRCVLLKAPRAGHGKTHLLTRMQHHLSASHEFIPLHAAQGARIDAQTVTDDALRRLVRPLPAAGGLCVLDLAVRRLFSEALQPLVRSGEVPCQDREGALAALRDRPVETFDFHQPHAVTAQWARENFEVLGPRLGLELAQRIGLSPRETGFWVEALFRFAAAPLEQPGRAAALVQAAFSESAGDGVAMERLSALLGMLTLLGRVVLVADELEGFSADESSALRLAAFIAALRQSVDRLDVILSLNQDIWETAFLPRLSGGLADRLSEVTIDLDPLTHDDMVALLNSRAPGLGERVMEHVEVGPMEHHARGLLRAAGATWVRAARGRQAAAGPPPPRQEVAKPTPPAELAPDDPAAAAEVPAVAAGAEPARAESPEQHEPAELHQAEVPMAGIMLEEAGAGFVPDAQAEAGDSSKAVESRPAPVNWAQQAAEAAGAEAQAAPPHASPGSTGSGSLAWGAPEHPQQPYDTEPREEAGGDDFARPAGDATAEAPGDSPQNPPQREPDRVDDLLRQFRERYGRGGL